MHVYLINVIKIKNFILDIVRNTTLEVPTMYYR